MQQTDPPLLVASTDQLGHTDQESAEFRGAAIKMRRLEIAATLAEWKRAFFVDGKERPFAERLTLEAEDAALAFEARVIGAAIEAAKVERRKRLNAALLPQLLVVLKERGLDEVVAEAEARSSAAAGS